MRIDCVALASTAPYPFPQAPMHPSRNVSHPIELLNRCSLPDTAQTVGYAGVTTQWQSSDGVHASQSLFTVRDQAQPQAYYPGMPASVPDRQFQAAVTASVADSRLIGAAPGIAKKHSSVKGATLHIGAPLKRPRGRSPTKVYTRGRTNKVSPSTLRLTALPTH